MTSNSDSYKKKNIAYFGSPGSFSHMATQVYFTDKPVSLNSQPTLEATFQAVEEGNATFGIVPWENSTTGSIGQTYDLLLESKLSIVGEVLLHIHHHLVGKMETMKEEKVVHCYSHPQAISQCDRFFKLHPWIIPKFTEDTATAAKEVAEKRDESNVAISSRLAAKIYNLTILREGIEDNQNNFTRFAIVSKKENNEGEKMSIAFSLTHIPGSLFQALRPFAEKGLNLTKIESRPAFGKTWEYIFFLDFEINKKQKNVKEALRELKEVTKFITLLGFYKKGNIYET